LEDCGFESQTLQDGNGVKAMPGQILVRNTQSWFIQIIEKE